MAEHQADGEWRDVERLLGRLDGAWGAAVSANGRIREVRVQPEDSPEDAWMDVRTALLATTGHSVADDEVDADPSAPEGASRWMLASIEWSREGRDTIVRVTLAEGGREWQGAARADEGGIARAAALATAEALRDALGGSATVSLADLREVAVAGQSAWLAALRQGGSGRPLLLGVALAGEGRNAVEAVARAVLDAANRGFRQRWSSSERQALLKFFAH